MPQSFFQSLDAIRRDLAHAFRSLAKARTFTLVCVISLGIGMGALVGSRPLDACSWLRLASSTRPG
jgi:hypothetical protein